MLIQTNHIVSDLCSNVYCEVGDSGYARAGTEWGGVSSSPPYARLYFFIEGDPYFKAGGKTLMFKKNHAYFLPSGFSFSYGCKSHMSQLYFHLNFYDMSGAELFRSETDWMYLALSVEKMKELLLLYQEENQLNALMLKQEILWCVLAMAQQRADFMPKPFLYSKYVKAALTLIKQNLSIQLNSSRLAEQLFVSKSTLERDFRREVGSPIGKYINSLVLFHAERLLLKTDLPISQISEILGFCDQFYFSRRFKVKFLQSPQRYRNQKLK